MGLGLQRQVWREGGRDEREEREGRGGREERHEVRGEGGTKGGEGECKEGELEPAWWAWVYWRRDRY